MRQIFFKTTDNQIIQHQTNLTLFVLDKEHPYGIGYRNPSSSKLSESKLNDWWNYVDELLLENTINNFYSIWRITDNGITYGFSN